MYISSFDWIVKHTWEIIRFKPCQVHGLCSWNRVLSEKREMGFKILEIESVCKTEIRSQSFCYSNVDPKKVDASQRACWLFCLERVAYSPCDWRDEDWSLSGASLESNSSTLVSTWRGSRDPLDPDFFKDTAVCVTTYLRSAVDVLICQRSPPRKPESWLPCLHRHASPSLALSVRQGYQDCCVREEIRVTNCCEISGRVSWVNQVRFCT